MRLTVSQLLARLTDRATNTFWGDAPLGDTSLAAGASSPASRHIVQLNVDPENRAQPTGMKEGLWAESEASGWRKADSGAVGGEGGVRSSGQISRQDQVGGWSQRQGGEEGGASR